MKSAGLRITSARMLVLKTLTESESPLNASQIHTAVVRDGGHIDMVSVYRVLAALAELEIIHHVGSVDGFTACRLNFDHDSLVAHLVCRGCGKAEERQIEQATAHRVRIEASASGFTASEIRIEVMGDCAVCKGA